jgi:hypothetical protein
MLTIAASSKHKTLTGWLTVSDETLPISVYFVMSNHDHFLLFHRIHCVSLFCFIFVFSNYLILYQYVNCWIEAYICNISFANNGDAKIDGQYFCFNCGNYYK